MACTREEEGGEGGGTQGETQAAQGDETTLLDEIKQRGTLRCGVNNTVPGFGFDPGTGEIEGFDIDFCRAFAAAVLGDSEAIDLVPIDADNRFIALQNGDYDVLARNTTWTTSRDGAEGVAFMHVNFYDGQAMMVREGDFSSIDEMDGTNVCVTTGTTTELNLADYFGARGLDFEPIAFEENPQLQRAFISGRCDGWTSDRSQLAGIRSQWPEEEGGPESLIIFDEVISKEPLAPGVLDSEIELHDALDAVVNGLILAEELGVTSANVEDTAEDPGEGPVAALLGAPVLDPETGESAPLDNGLGITNNFMIDVISAVGNYGEIFDRHVGPESDLELERGINALWTDGGIQYAIPFR
ncbi:MAG: amino acid ABC transporter substrate-binding protein [Actinobacteria bacterium]|nr:amino acid ABC transporter substrate-binding protein [Actinomycetota bacterium]